MLQNNIQMTYFIEQIKSIVSSMVLKRDKLAAVFETDLEATKRADKYINTIENGDLWDSYVTFDSDVLLEAGLDKNLINWYMENKNNIPRESRDKVVALQKEKIISSYIEENDYYRMLNGEPPIATTPADWVYAPPNSFDIPTNIPVHKLSEEYTGFLRSSGMLDTLIAQNPDKGYLNFIGNHAISYYKSRTANNYDILYVDTRMIESNIYTDFKLAYEKARTYYMVGIYNMEYANMFTWYDEFIGFSILVMTIQRMIGNIFKQGTTRDFYDVELIKYLFKSYSIPYIEDMELRYQKNLAKSLNVLLQYKSTNTVLYEVSRLLGFYNINIYKYYLVKSQKLDTDGNPIFVYDQIEEPDGSITQVPLYENMFTFHFQQINLQEKDLNTALTDSRNTLDYTTIIVEDPYWNDDDELKQKLYTSNFNNILTKYMSLDIAFKIVEMMYEVSHTLRMFIDNQKDFKLITVEIPKISSNAISLYDLVIFLCVLGSAKLSLKGSIPIKGYQIASVYGFNFKANLEQIRNDIYNNEGDYTMIDPELVKYILNMRAVDVSDVDRLFNNITEFRKLITRYLFLTKDKETYYQYKKLYNALLLAEDVEDLYKDTDGNYQETYKDLLREINPELYTISESIKDSELDEYINAIYIKLGSLSSSYKYLSTINNNDSLFEFVMKLIRFFKSYTVDFVNSGIHYFLDDRYLMAMKIIDQVYRSTKIDLKDEIFRNGLVYKDIIETLSITNPVYHKLNLKENYDIESNIPNKDYELLTDKMVGGAISEIDTKEKFRFIDNMHFTEKSLDIQDRPSKIRKKLLTDMVFIQTEIVE